MFMNAMIEQINKADEAEIRIQSCRERRANTLDLSDLSLSEIPDEVKNMTYLRSINLSENRLTELPDFICSYTSLENLDVSYNKLSYLPDAIGSLGSLENLNARCNQLNAIPVSIEKLSMLSFLDISYNRLSALPDVFNGLSRLDHCNIKGNNITLLPEKVSILSRPKQLTILQHMERITSLSGSNSLSEDFFLTAKPHIDYIAQKLNITPIQTVLLSHIIEEYEGSAISLNQIARSLNCNKIRIMQYVGELADLADKKIIKTQKNSHRGYGDKGEIMYRIPLKVTEALSKNENYVPINCANLSILDFFTILEELFVRKISDDEISYEELKEEINALLNDNRELSFVKKLKEYDLSADEQLIVIRFCHFYTNKDLDEMDLNNLSRMFDLQAAFTPHKRKLLSGEHNLIARGIIENTNNDGFSDRESFKLTDKVKQELLYELKIKKVYNPKNIIKANNIKEKKLFYNATEGEQVGRLSSLLDMDSFKEVQTRLSENNMRTGFACLFYGPPGCGKTETAYQIARQSGRDIVAIDISETKSMWFGESEKKIKEVFTSYRNLVDESEVTPILLINEADAVIGKRKDVSRSSVAQTENAIQNIILQELENLKGILIATTNLTENMDKAFERRFLYKIEFQKPSLSIRKSIWQFMIPALSDVDATALSSRFDYSGGQIENIARKRTVEYVISGIEPSLEKITTFCQEEQLSKETSRIGFGV
jgi:hypothetical protein